MEQKVIEKLDLAVKTLNEKIKIYNEESYIFRSELFTEDVWKMIFTIMDGDSYLIMDNIGNDSWSLRFCADRDIFFLGRDFKAYELTNIRHNSHTIDVLKKRTKDYNKSVEALNYLKENAKEIIDWITDNYKAITERQTDELDSILADLDADFEPTKHIKVTVEWV